MRRLLATVLGLALIGSGSAWAQADFGTSLHATRAGKGYWYDAENGGFETLTGAPIEDMGCKECHGATNALGQAPGSPYAMGCNDCHAADFSVAQSQCLTCHSRQGMEAVTMAIPDVHRSAGMVCWDCHSSGDIHGDGTAYANQYEPGAIDASCEGCHASLPADHAAHDPHGGKLHCAACHASTVISCYNCHLESQVQSHVKRAKQPLRDFVLLVNRQRDGKVGVASFQSLSYQGRGWVAFGPYTPHTITRSGRVCTDCHANQGGQVPAIEEYNRTGAIQFARLNGDGSLSWVHGVVPMPVDYQTSFRLDFIKYNGATSDPAVASSNWSAIGKNVPDGSQMLYASPLTREQMSKLGFAQPATAVLEPETLPAGTQLLSSYPNPFNHSTLIRFTLTAEAEVELGVYDGNGQETARLLAGRRSAGSYQVEWDGTDQQGQPVGTGVYVARMVADGIEKTTKLTLVK